MILRNRSYRRHTEELARLLRAAVSDYRFDHGVWPGMGLDTVQDMSSKDARARIIEQQLSAYSDIAGRTSDS